MLRSEFGVRGTLKKHKKCICIYKICIISKANTWWTCNIHVFPVPKCHHHISSSTLLKFNRFFFVGPGAVVAAAVVAFGCIITAQYKILYVQDLVPIEFWRLKSISHLKNIKILFTFACKQNISSRMKRYETETICIVTQTQNVYKGIRNKEWPLWWTRSGSNTHNTFPSYLWFERERKKNHCKFFSFLVSFSTLHCKNIHWKRKLMGLSFGGCRVARLG